jgi:hypothetical protein
MRGWKLLALAILGVTAVHRCDSPPSAPEPLPTRDDHQLAVTVP